MSAAIDLDQQRRQEVSDFARVARLAGFSVVPPCEDGTKKPIKTWKQYQRTHASDEEFAHWYDGATRQGVGVITGEISGGLECLDFDDRDAWGEYVDLAKQAGLGELLGRVAAGYREQTPNGMHLFWRCESIGGNQKIAWCPDKRKARIETRGEGGFVVVAPSHGRVHADGDYSPAEGGPATIETVTADERDDLLNLARAMDEAGAAKAAAEYRRTEAPLASTHGVRPGDDYARHTPWSDILEPHGWRQLFTTGDGTTHWCRPGKRSGTSATTGHAGTDFLYVFSTSTEFESGRGYGKFSAFALLEHGSDFKAAARALREGGFGETSSSSLAPTRLIDASELVQAGSVERPPRLPPELLDVPGIVGELARYITETAPIPQPEFSLAAALVGMATLAGRKVQGPSGLRPNLYTLGLGESGSGKEHPRSALRRTFETLGVGPMVGVDDVTGGAAINGVLLEQPSCALLFDEFGHQISAYKSAGDGGTVSTLLKLYGIARDVYRGRTYALDRRTGRKGTDYVVPEPNVSVLATSVPGRFWEALASGSMDDGFLSRFLLFQGATDLPEYQFVPVERSRPPLTLLERMRPWATATEATVDDAGDPVAPSVCVATADPGFMAMVEGAHAEKRRWMARMVREGNSVAAALVNRLPAHAEKLALIRAAGRAAFPQETHVCETDAAWGLAVARYCVESIILEASAHIADSPYHRSVKQAAAFLKQQGTATRSAFTTKFQRVDGRTRDDVLRTLVESGQVEVATARTGKRGPATEVLRWLP